MVVRAGREFLAIPGPTTIPDEVLNAMHRPAVDIYSGPLVAMTDGLLDDLKRVFRTEGRTYIYIANGHGTWEAALSNVLSPGEHVLVLASGRFALGWGATAEGIGLKTETIDAGWHAPVSPEALEARLRLDREGRIKAILVVQVDTASGVVNDIPALSAAIRRAGHDALLMVDAVASLGCIPFEMDAWGVDVAMSASQKGLMTPPGLGFIAAGARARERHRTANLRTPYWDWTAREGEIHYQKYCGTPPEHLLFGLRQALDMLLAEGLPAIHTRHSILARTVRRAVEVWAGGGALGFNITAPAARSDTVTVVTMGGGHETGPLFDYARDKCGVILGSGIGDLSGKAFRIAHMGHVNAPMILGTLGVVETALKALGIPHGAGGVSAAITQLAEDVRA